MEVHYVYLEVATEYVYNICVKFAIRERNFILVLTLSSYQMLFAYTFLPSYCS
jgi:hypothetical protein